MSLEEEIPSPPQEIIVRPKRNTEKITHLVLAQFHLFNHHNIKTRCLTCRQDSIFYPIIPVGCLQCKVGDMSKGFVPPRLHQPLAITTRKPLQKLTRLRGIGISLTHFYLFSCFWCLFGVCLVSVK